MTFLGRLDKWTRKLENVRQAIAEAILGKREEDKTVTGRRALHTRLVRFYGIQEMADELKASEKSFFQMKGGSRYAIATRTVTEKGFWGTRVTKEVPTNFVRVGFDSRPVKVRKRQRRIARFLQQQAIASVAAKASS